MTDEEAYQRVKAVRRQLRAEGYTDGRKISEEALRRLAPSGFVPLP